MILRNFQSVRIRGSRAWAKDMLMLCHNVCDMARPIPQVLLGVDTLRHC
jgi:hypothetical protein